MDKLANRIFGIDFYRIICVTIIFLFHSFIHINCSYGFLNYFISKGYTAMTGFFLLSGGVLYCKYNNINLLNKDRLKEFYIKRLFAIFPLYIIVSMLYIIFLGSESIKENLILMPIEILGLQSFFSTLFPISHNVGTWFISCLLFCYFIFPFINYLISLLSKSKKIILIVLIQIIMIFGCTIVSKFNIQNLYSNPFFRLLEFVCGIIVMSLAKQSSILQKKSITPYIAFFILLLLWFSTITVAEKTIPNINLFETMSFYDAVSLPFLIMILFVSNKIKCKVKILQKVSSICSSLIYEFFMAQFFTWPITNALCQLIGCESNLFKILSSFLICVIITIIMYLLITKNANRLCDRIYK